MALKVHLFFTAVSGDLIKGISFFDIGLTSPNGEVTQV